MGRLESRKTQLAGNEELTGDSGQRLSHPDHGDAVQEHQRKNDRCDESRWESQRAGEGDEKAAR
jgi:hypothetical protein